MKTLPPQKEAFCKEQRMKNSTKPGEQDDQGYGGAEVGPTFWSKVFCGPCHA